MGSGPAQAFSVPAQTVTTGAPVATFTFSGTLAAAYLNTMFAFRGNGGGGGAPTLTVDADVSLTGAGTFKRLNGWSARAVTLGAAGATNDGALADIVDFPISALRVTLGGGDGATSISVHVTRFSAAEGEAL